jgi:hypothetical protein
MVPMSCAAGELKRAPEMPPNRHQQPTTSNSGNS